MKLAADRVQRITMELGGHAPVLVFDDCDLETTLDRVVTQKFRNAGQVCVSPTRFYVQDGIYDAFVKGFAERTARVKIGSGLDAGTQMGPLANARRAPALEAMIADATAKGARVIAGGAATGEGYFFQPTALADVPLDADAMNNEPFGPVSYTHLDVYKRQRPGGARMRPRACSPSSMPSPRRGAFFCGKAGCGTK